MTDADRLAFVLRVLRAVDPMECESLLWRTDGAYAPVTFMVGCNDLFSWGCADCEQVTPDNVGEMERARVDIRAACPGDRVAEVYTQDLFCCRVQKMRPQGACYPDDRRLWPLFDACGPEREVGLGNPYKPGERNK